MFVPLRSQQSKKYLTIMETIQNELLTVEVSAMGAELQSIKDSDGREYHRMQCQ